LLKEFQNSIFEDGAKSIVAFGLNNNKEIISMKPELFELILTTTKSITLKHCKKVERSF